MIRTKLRMLELKSMTEAQLEAEWRRVYPGKKSPLNKRKKRQALMARKAPRMTPEEFVAQQRQFAADRGARCQHGTLIEQHCEACRVEADAVTKYTRLNKVSEEQARQDLCLKAIPASPEPVASVPTKPLAPVTPENDPTRPVMDAEDLVGFAKSTLGVDVTPAQAAMAKEIAAHKKTGKRG
jgi:hypothetical protein